MSLLHCPICDKPVDPDKTPTPPFCSRRCCQIDLARWLDERYGLPYEREEEANGPEAGQ